MFTNSIKPLNLDQEYTYLKSHRKTNPLSDFSRQLSKQKQNKLPKIENKGGKSARQLKDDVDSLKILLLKREKRMEQILSEQRFAPKYPFPMMPMPVMATMPIQFQQSQLLPLQSKVIHKEEIPSKEPQSPIYDQPKEEEESSTKKFIPTKKQIPKFKEKSKLNRFRICAYAVYFSIYIKYFTKKFTENRKNWFDERYAVNNGKVIFDGSANILRQLYELDITKMIMDGKKKAKIDPEFQKIKKDDEKTEFIGGMPNFLMILLDFMHELMTTQKFIDENHEVFTVGVLTQNFMISNLYLPQQAQILHIHPAGYIQIDEKTEILMLMIKIVVKITVFNFLLNLKHSRKWNIKQEKTYNFDEADMEDLWRITHSSGVFLIIICEEIYEASVRNITHTCNFNEMAPKYGIIAAKTLEYLQKEMKQNSKSAEQNVERSRFILKLKNYGQMKILISKHPYLQKFKIRLKQKLIDFLTQVYTCLKFEQHVVYDFIRNMTYDEQFLIFKGKTKEIQEKKKKKKQRKNNSFHHEEKRKSIFGGKSTKNSKWNSVDDQGDEQKNESKNNYEKGTSIYENDNEDQDEEDDEDEKMGQSRSRRRMKYKHEQIFHDKKFPGHTKLERLKNKMNLIKKHKII